MSAFPTVCFDDRDRRADIPRFPHLCTHCTAHRLPNRLTEISPAVCALLDRQKLARVRRGIMGESRMLSACPFTRHRSEPIHAASPRATPSTRQDSAHPEAPGLRALALLVTGVIVICALYFGRAVMIPIILAILLSFLLVPFVDMLRRLRLGQVPSVLRRAQNDRRGGERAHRADRRAGRATGERFAEASGGHRAQDRHRAARDHRTRRRVSRPRIVRAQTPVADARAGAAQGREQSRVVADRSADAGRSARAACRWN